MKRIGLFKLVLLVLIVAYDFGCQQGGSDPSSSSPFTLRGLRSWSTTYGGTEDDRARDVQQTADGGYIVVGETASVGGGEKDAWVMKQDPDGNVEWSRSYGDGNIRLTNDISPSSANGALDSNHVDVKTTDDGGCILAGAIFDGYPDGEPGDGIFDTDENVPIFQIGVVKLNASGRVQWRRIYPGGERGGRAVEIRKTSSGGYVIAGYVESPGVNLDERNRDLLILRLNSQGDEEWRFTREEPGHEVATCIAEAPDGNFVIGAIRRVEDEDFNSTTMSTVTKVDGPEQDVIWTRNAFGGEGIGLFSIARAANGRSYTVVGRVRDDVNDHYGNLAASSFNVWAQNVRDSDGEELWQEYFESNGNFNNAGDHFFAAKSLGGGGFAAVGYLGIFSRDGWLVQFNADGDVEHTRSFSHEFESPNRYQQRIARA